MAAEQAVPEGLAALPPGPGLAAVLADIDLAQVPNDDIDDVLLAQSRQLAHDQARMFAALDEVVCRRPFAGPGEVRRADTPELYGADEVRAALAWTRRAAEAETDLAVTLVHDLPQVYAALSRGDLDRPKARVFAQHLADLPAAQIAAVCAAVLPHAHRLTTGQISERIKRLILELDPAYYERRYRKAVRDRRVVAYLNADGTAVLSASGLPADEAAAAWERLDALAHAARHDGHPATLNQIRADLVLGLLDGSLHGLDRAEILHALLERFAGHCNPGQPEPGGSEPGGPGSGGPRPGGSDSDGPGTGGAGSGGTGSGGPEPGGPGSGNLEPSGPGPGSPEPGGPEPGGRPGSGSPDSDGPRPDDPRPDSPDHGDSGAGSPAFGSGGPDADGPSTGGRDADSATRDSDARDSDARDSDARDSEAGDGAATGNGALVAHPIPVVDPSAASGAPTSANALPPARRATVGGRTGVEIRVPLSTLLGLDDRAGELPGWGPVPASVARRIVARQPRAQWRWVVVDDHGHLLVEGLTRHRPTPRNRRNPAGLAGSGGPGRDIVELHIPEDLLATLAANATRHGRWAAVITDIAARYQDHRRHAAPGADLDAHPDDRVPRAGLRRHTQVRDRFCVHPGCRTAARRCDQDHTIDHARGGPTTRDDLAPLCRHDHMLKTEGGWRLDQPEPGRFLWTSPLGRVYPVDPEPILPPPVPPVPCEPEPEPEPENPAPGTAPYRPDLRRRDRGPPQERNAPPDTATGDGPRDDPPPF